MCAVVFIRVEDEDDFNIGRLDEFGGVEGGFVGVGETGGDEGEGAGRDVAEVGYVEEGREEG